MEVWYTTLRKGKQAQHIDRLRWNMWAWVIVTVHCFQSWSIITLEWWSLFTVLNHGPLLHLSVNHCSLFQVMVHYYIVFKFLKLSECISLCTTIVWVCELLCCIQTPSSELGTAGVTQNMYPAGPVQQNAQHCKETEHALLSRISHLVTLLGNLLILYDWKKC